MNAKPTMSIARRNMMAGKARTAFSVLGVAIATLLLLFVIALYRGWNQELVGYIRETDADLWVVSSGSDSFFTPSVMFSAVLPKMRATEGVASVQPLVGRPMKLRQPGPTIDGVGEGWDTYVIGFNKEAGGPIRVKKGSGTPKVGEIVIDDVLARTAGVKLGDTVQLGLRTLKVVGISGGGNLVLAQLSFVAKEESDILTGIDAIVNFALVKTKSGESPVAVGDRIETNVQGVTAYTSSQFADNSQKVLRRSILPILFVIVLMAVIVGTIVVGLTVYTAAVEKEREFGILKAIGVPGPGLLRVVFEQSLICGAIGFVVGVALTVLVANAAQMILPQVVTLFRWQDIMLVLAATALMSLVASLIPMQRVIRVDTLSVFKA